MKTYTNIQKVFEALPARFVQSRKWEKVEARLGVKLPPSYKILVDVYGASRWEVDGNVVEVMSPFARTKRSNLFDHNQHWVANLAFELPQTLLEASPFLHETTLGGLMAWGSWNEYWPIYFVLKGDVDLYPILVQKDLVYYELHMLMTPQMLIGRECKDGRQI